MGEGDRVVNKMRSEESIEGRGKETEDGAEGRREEGENVG